MYKALKTDEKHTSYMYMKIDSYLQYIYFKITILTLTCLELWG